MIERELIAATMRQPNLLWQVEVQPDHFESAVHAQIWEKLQELQREGSQFDPVTVAQALPAHADRIITIANESIGSAAAAKGYARKIIEGWRNRKASDIYAAALDGQKDIDQTIRELMALHQERDRFECTIDQAIRRALEDMEEAQAAGGGMRGITTGLADLDRHLGGWHPGDLIIEAARPSMGKTALMLHHAARCKVPLGVITSEQPAYQVAQRHFSSIGKVSLANLRQGKIGEKEMQAVIQTKHKLKDYWMLDRSSPTISEVERVARRWHHEHGIKILFVDYIQRIKGQGDKKHEQVGDVVRSLKTLARDLNIPVVALAQVNRDVEKLSNKRPGMAHLADSSEIEKEADQVITLYRDEVYHDDSKDKGIAELSICKNRHGYVGTVRCEWIGEFVSFGDMRYGS